MSTANNTPTVPAHAQQTASGRKSFRRVLVRFAGESRFTSVSVDGAFVELTAKFVPGTAFGVYATLRKAASKMQKPTFGQASSAVRLKAIAMLRGSYRPDRANADEAAERSAAVNNAAWSATG
jgi:hypothetical protein